MTLTDLVVPVVELLGAGLAAEVPGDAVHLPGDAALAHLLTVVTRHTLQTQPPSKTLLEQQLTAWEEKREEERGSRDDDRGRDGGNSRCTGRKRCIEEKR